MVEAPLGLKNYIIQKQPQEQPNSGGVCRPDSFFERTAIIAKPISPANEVLSSKFNHGSTISLTLSWSRDKGLEHGVRGIRRGRRLGCRCAMRGINHQCGERISPSIKKYDRSKLRY